MCDNYILLYMDVPEHSTLQEQISMYRIGSSIPG